jgi:hypothetical protein
MPRVVGIKLTDMPREQQIDAEDVDCKQACWQKNAKTFELELVQLISCYAIGPGGSISGNCRVESMIAGAWQPSSSSCDDMRRYNTREKALKYYAKVVQLATKYIQVELNATSSEQEAGDKIDGLVGMKRKAREKTDKSDDEMLEKDEIDDQTDKKAKEQNDEQGDD